MIEIFKSKVMILFVIFFVTIIYVDAVNTKKQDQALAKSEEQQVIIVNK